MQPFPWNAVQSLSRAGIANETRLRRLAREHVRTGELEAAFTELAGERVQIRVRRFKLLDKNRGADDALGVVLAPAGDLSTSRRVLVEVEGTLGAAIVARALRQRAPRITDPARTASPALAGAFAAVLVTALRRAHGALPLAVLSAGPAWALARDLAGAEPRTTTAMLTVLVGDDAFEARVSVPDTAESTSSSFVFDVRELAAMGDVPIALPIVGARTLASRADLAALRPGDAFLPGRHALTIASEGKISGPVMLVPPHGERGLTADLADSVRLVVRGGIAHQPWEEPVMSGAPESEAASSASITAQVIEEAPIVVRVELGAVEMSARNWASLAEGDVMTLGRRLGEPAILRVGGVEVARGELVIVEGEMAVRITKRTSGGL